ncbi:MAG: hypothetical protein ACJ74Z_19310, partial [Bryobacteraceae bacterium]
IKRDLENQIRGLLKNVGLVIGRAKFNVFAVRAEELIEDRPDLIAVVGPLLKARKAIEQQTDDLDRKVLKLARYDAQVRRFMTVPGVGPITALCFKATIDDPTLSPTWNLCDRIGHPMFSNAGRGPIAPRCHVWRHRCVGARRLTSRQRGFDCSRGYHRLWLQYGARAPGWIKRTSHPGNRATCIRALTLEPALSRQVKRLPQRDNLLRRSLRFLMRRRPIPRMRESPRLSTKLSQVDVDYARAKDWSHRP